MIDGRTRLVGLIGWPVEHSLSPVMHNAAFAALGLNWRYVPLPVPPEQLEAAVRGLAALGFRGANVTVPHKQTVLPALDSISPNAKELGAVNTLLVERSEDGRATITGYNTDAQGFIDALRAGGFEPEKGRRAVVVGAGGAARAVVYGLLHAGMREIILCNRSLARAQTLISDLASDQQVGRLHARPLTPETLVESVQTADLLVNATPVGLWPHTDDSIWPEEVRIPAHLTVFDLVYNPLETRLLHQARKAGARVISGLGMLVYQGAAAFELWTGKKAPIETMQTALREAIA